MTSELTKHRLTGDLEAAVNNPALRGQVAPVFVNGLHIAIYAAVAVLVVGVVFSALRGDRPVRDVLTGPGIAPSPADQLDPPEKNRDVH